MFDNTEWVFYEEWEFYGEDKGEKSDGNAEIFISYPSSMEPLDAFSNGQFALIQAEGSQIILSYGEQICSLKTDDGVNFKVVDEYFMCPLAEKWGGFVVKEDKYIINGPDGKEWINMAEDDFYAKLY